jgi:hypothetical protein
MRLHIGANPESRSGAVIVMSQCRKFAIREFFN